MNVTPAPVSPTLMEPLMPTAARAQLEELTVDVFRAAGRLSAHIPAGIVRGRAADLVLEMNSYYSNLIEGHKTLPRDIEKALRREFSNDPGTQANQRLARAHIEVERLMRERLEKEPELSIHSAEFLCWLHGEFYARLPEEMHWSVNEKGKKYRIGPGEVRSFEVTVGSHLPPNAQSVRSMLERFAQGYGSKEISATDELIALAAAHHRLAWIHPFGDGNGRVTRLYSHAWIVRAKVDGFGLWTLSRGLARHREKYFSALKAADQKRWNDLDGRGNLSDRGLGDFCRFFLKTMLEQIEFMGGLFQFEQLSTRIEKYLHFELAEISDRQRERLWRLLRAALLEGEIERGRVGEIVGLSGTMAREIIRLALRHELLDSPSPKGALRLVFSAKTLESYFPQLYQDLPV
jgi:Fic family protein